MVLLPTSADKLEHRSVLKDEETQRRSRNRVPSAVTAVRLLSWHRLFFVFMVKGDPV